MDILQIIFTTFVEKQTLEIIGVFLGLAYLILVMRENIWCWACAFISTSIFIYLFWSVFLFMEAALNVFYLAMAVYGFQKWRNRGPLRDEKPVEIHFWSIKAHAVAISSVLLLSAITGYLLDRYTPAAWPYIDSFTTWSSVITTFMVVKKVMENWIYWFVIDAISMVVFWERELYFLSALFALYLVLVVIGYVSWQNILKSKSTAITAS